MGSDTDPDPLRDLTVRTVTEAEIPAYARSIDAAFGEEMSDERLAVERRTFEPERFLGAFAPDGQVVGSAGAFTFDLALPGGTSAGCAGITAVAVRQDHRRRGLLTSLLGRLLTQAHDRQEPFAALWASEGAIYGRYGFGPAIPTIRIDVPRAQLRLRDPVDSRDVRVLPGEQALEELPDLYARARAQRPGLLSRHGGWWQRLVVDDPVADREGAGPRTVAVLPDGGYLLYRLRPRWEDAVPCGTVEVEEFVSLHPRATAALWAFLAATDLASSVTVRGCPTDEPLHAMVHDPAQVRIRSGAPVYLRILDVPAALAARRYLVDESVVLAVTEPSAPERPITCALEVVDGVGHAEPTTAAPDVRLGVEELAMLYLGGIRPSVLVQAGRLVVAAPGVVPRLDRLFASAAAPMQPSGF